MRVDVRHAVGELVQVGLAGDDAAGLADAGDDRRVVLGGDVGQDDAAGSRHHALHVDQVFDRDGVAGTLFLRARDESVELHAPQFSA